MNIDPDIFRTRGRAPRLIDASVVRELDEVDLRLMAEENGSEAPALKRLSERHHGLARNIASGMPLNEAAHISGYVASRVSILLADPAFKELVAFYEKDLAQIRRDRVDMMAGLHSDVLNLITERLEEEPEKVTIGQLLEIGKFTADRSGMGPQSSTTNVNVNVDLAGRLQRARERVAQRQIEGKVL